MDDIMMDPKEKEAMSISEQIHDAARLVENAIRNEDVSSKKALQSAAKVLIDNAMARFDESIGASIADDEDE